MKCVFCGGEMTDQTVRVVFEDDEYVVVENVPAQVCDQCGERTYSPEVTDELLAIANNKKPPARTISVPVFDYSAISG